ncbi:MULTISPECIES: site-2 protease family protein [unclassified Pseudomonas]|uniref:site-2 protease family protein n=1 Tax=unclassified Pseudomonas TaxID=196821 RepID=UPI002446F717|nr:MULTISPECIES: site-2 protease family protein [unclassified Pseudomonas]MDG9925671.1 HlyD family efflux transporter periplasmic adaptor subunit [Pseudomonas sp. GD04045]MDH0037212.1 HlyD family efflux transporter periplasmic adaptor subunit [Pseudomonas sp. GD04019]
MLDPADLPTPSLREDLRLSEGNPGPSGEPCWMIHDSVVNRFYRIGWLEFECLLRWGKTPRQICQQIGEQTPLQPEVEQVLGLRQFLEHNQLLRPDAAAIARLRTRSEGNQWLTWKWWLHHYLFFRVPLLHPQQHLQRLAGHLDWLFHPFAAWLVLLLGALGVMLVLQQWDSFAHAVLESFSLDGMLSFALALAVAKTIHELGHALVATRLGLRVAHMGIAFVVLWPMLYTDTSESWRLRSSRQRLAIASAGILAELALAGLATLGWALSEPGMLRNALLYLATTSWILSLALNLSPFMRFDGYFILSDLLDFPNLHERSSALARVSIRRSLLGLDEPWPEHFPDNQRRLLVTFAVLTWMYRLVLFLGIALAVYLMFFKALGIFLFLVEIAWFVVMPVWRELEHWWTARAGIPRRRRYLLWGIAAAALLLLALPWHSQVEADGVARAAQQLRVFSPYPALLKKVHPIGTVEAGATLAVLDEPDIAARMQANQANIDGYRARLGGLLADPAGLQQQSSTEQRLDVELEQVRSAQAEIQRLVLRTPFAGRWQDTDPQWQAGQWIGSQEQIGVLIDPSSWQVDAYVKQDQVHLLSAGDSVRFYPSGQPIAIVGRVLEVASTQVTRLSHRMLAAELGGPITTSREGDGLIPSTPLFHVLIQLDAPPGSPRETLGHLQIDGRQRSLLGEMAIYTAGVLLRESGF